MTIHTYTPKPMSYQVSTVDTLQSPGYRPDKTVKVKVSMARSNQDQTMMLHTYTPTNVPTKYHPPTPYGS